MPQLAEGAPRNHPPNFRKAAVRTYATSGGGSSKPQASAGMLNVRRQQAIIDHFLPDGCNATRFVERRWANENTSAGRACGATPGISDPRGRIKLEEEIDKRWNQELLRQGLAMEVYHE